MNFFQFLTLFLGEYPQEYTTALVMIQYQKITGRGIGRDTVAKRLLQPIEDYKYFPEHFNDTLCAVADTDIRAAIEAKLKEVEIV